MSDEKVREFDLQFSDLCYDDWDCKVTVDKGTDVSVDPYEEIRVIEKSAFDELMKNARALRDNLKTITDTNDRLGNNQSNKLRRAEIMGPAKESVINFDKKYPQLNEKEYGVRKYRKKPVVIEAVQYLSDEKSYNDIIKMGCPRVEYADRWAIATLEGEMSVSHGDYIIKGVKGEFYPCKPDIFKMTYDEVKNDPTT